MIWICRFERGYFLIRVRVKNTNGAFAQKKKSKISLIKSNSISRAGNFFIRFSPPLTAQRLLPKAKSLTQIKHYSLSPLRNHNTALKQYLPTYNTIVYEVFDENALLNLLDFSYPLLDQYIRSIEQLLPPPPLLQLLLQYDGYLFSLIF